MTTHPPSSLASSSWNALDLGSWRAPSFEHATVADVMGAPVIACAADTPLTSVAQIMATRHVHAIVVVDDDKDPLAWRVLSDRTLAVSGAAAERLTAGQVAERPREAAEGGWPLERAARLMAEHGVSHLVVVEADGRPAGMLSTLDLAGVVAWGRA